MANDALMPRFLYTMLKQLDLKGIDWSIVSRELNITNGHAARMRYSRFKQQMEGKATTPRRSKPAGGGAQNKKKDRSSNANNANVKTDSNLNDPFLDDKSKVKLEDGRMGVGDEIGTPASDQLSQMDVTRDGNAGGSPGVEQLSPTQNRHRTPNLPAPNMGSNGNLNFDSDHGSTPGPYAQRRVKSEPRDDDAVMHNPFTPSRSRVVHTQTQDSSQETDADADAEVDAEVDAAFELGMHAHPPHADPLLNGSHPHNHSHASASSFSSSVHHSFGHQSQEAMMSFSSAGSGEGMYAPSHRQAGMMQSQSFPQHQHVGGYLVMQYGEEDMGPPLAMMPMGGGGMVGNGGGAYVPGGMVPGMGGRAGMKMEERWGDEYCA